MSFYLRGVASYVLLMEMRHVHIGMSVMGLAQFMSCCAAAADHVGRQNSGTLVPPR
jgi:hypothetical protein